MLAPSQAFMDSACGYAALSVAPEGCDVLSVEFKVNLLAPAVGEHFVARAHVEARRENAYCLCGRLFCLEGRGRKDRGDDVGDHHGTAAKIVITCYAREL